MATEVSTTTTTVNRVTVILTGPENWDIWLTRIRLPAAAADVWDYIDPYWPRSGADGTEPQPIHSEPARPTAEKLFSKPLPDLNDGEVRVWTDELAKHKQQYKAYIHRRNTLIEISKEILDTIDLRCLQYISAVATTREQLLELKKRVAPSDYTRELTMAHRLTQHLLSIKSESILDWIDQWELLIAEARQIDLPGVNRNPDVRALLSAVAFISPNWAAIQSNQLEQDLSRNCHVPKHKAYNPKCHH